MNNDLEIQRRQLWIDSFCLLYAPQGNIDSELAAKCSDHALLEFDKRFNPTQSGMMDEKEFESWLSEQIGMLKEKAGAESNRLFDYSLGAWAAYNEITGKE